jgi:hypothetical protein
LARTISRSSARRARIAAHLILGSRPEPFLAALCDSIAQACDVLIVNDNAAGASPHTAVLEASPFGKSGRLLVDRTAFTDFCSARNVCLKLHREHDAGDWVAAVDADDVHGIAVTRIARNLVHVPARFDFIDGYIRHFFQSFDRFTSVDRHRSFFRFHREIRWERAVHEQLHGLSGERLALPYVYAHYGWVVPAQVHADKLRQYLSLGAPDEADEETLLDVDPRSYVAFAKRWDCALHFTGPHPPAALPTIERIRAERAADFQAIEAYIRRTQRPAVRLRNALMKWNFELRWRGRALNPLARRLLA